MNVTIKVSITDEDRNRMFRHLHGDSKKLVSRKDVNEFVQEKIRESLNGTEERAVQNPPASLTSDDFKPSRGDEPYMLKVKDESLRDIHTRMLDDIEKMEAKVWEEIEKNRRA